MATPPTRCSSRSAAARAARDFDAALAAAVPVAPAVDRFFNDVLVNTDDLVISAA